jgi:hypothetical protein
MQCEKELLKFRAGAGFSLRPLTAGVQVHERMCVLHYGLRTNMTILFNGALSFANG